MQIKLTMKLTKKQIRILSDVSGWPNAPKTFGIIGQPYLPTGELRILIITGSSLRIANSFFKKLKLRTLKTIKQEEGIS